MKVRLYSPEDEQKVLDTMSKAFMDDPLYKIFVQDKANRMMFLRRFMKFRLKYGLKKGIVFVTDDCRGISVWIKPGQKMSAADVITLGGLYPMLKYCSSKERKTITDFNSFADGEREKALKTPAWHLSPIAVSPEFQNKGYGRMLMEKGMEAVKNSQTPCCLETQSSENIHFYENFGFAVKSQAVYTPADLKSYVMVFENQ